LPVGNFARLLAVDAILPTKRAKRSDGRLGRFAVGAKIFVFFLGRRNLSRRFVRLA